MRSGPTKEGDDPEREFDDFGNEPTLEEEVETMNQLYRRNQLRGERMTRRIADATAAGMSTEEAFELAMREEGLEPPRLHDEFEGGEDRLTDLPWESSSEPEPWREEIDSQPRDESSAFENQPEHPTVQRAEKLLLEIMKLRDPTSRSDSFANTATRGMIDVVGGLVQATCGDLDDRSDRALAIVQLKRALKGHAFCRGAIFGLSGTDQIDQATSDRFQDELAAILESIHHLLAAAWDESAPPTTQHGCP
jgi:hypothetical protein